MSEESEGYHTHYCIAWDGYDHREWTSDMSDYKEDNEYLERFGLNACRVDERLVEEVVHQLGKAEYCDKYGCEYPEIHVQADRAYACILEYEAENGSKGASQEGTHIWYDVEDACHEGYSQ